MNGLSMSIEDYRSKWANWHTTGPIDWRGPHHGIPDAEFATLCAEAERQELIVELGVSDGLLGYTGSKYRRLTTINVCRGPRTLVTIGFDTGDSWRDAAARARKALETL